MAFEHRIPEGTEPSEDVLDIYSRVSLLAGKPAAFRVSRILGRALRKGSRVLDIGTGPAAIPLFLARVRPGTLLFGMDISQGMLKRAGRSASRLGTRCFLAAGDGENLPVRDDAVDVVICLFALHHMEHPGYLLLEMDRVLRPGGSLLLIDFRRDMPRGLFRALDGMWQLLFLRTPARFGFRDSVRSAWRPDEIAALAERHRLERFRVSGNLAELFITTKPERLV